MSKPRSLSDIAELGDTLERIAPRILWLPGNTNRIDAVEALLWERASRFAGLRVVQLLSLGKGWSKAIPHIRLVTPFIGPGARELVHRGFADFLPCHLSFFPSLTRPGPHGTRGRYQPDVAIAHVSRPDPLGRVTLGLDAGLSWEPVQHAGITIAVMNSQMPKFVSEPIMTERYRGKPLASGCAMPLDAFDYVLEHDAPLMAHPASTASEEALAIGKRIASYFDQHGKPLIQKGATLQLGIGDIPDGILRALESRTDLELGIHSEMISDGVLRLMRAGVITGRRKTLLRNKVVIGFAIGSNELYDALEDPEFVILPQEFVNDPHIVARSPRMTSINGALAVSLLGDVCASHIGHLPYSGIGGARDFALGAHASDGGRSIIALPSTYTDRATGKLASRITLALPEGSHVTVNYDTAQFIATEHGVAELEGMTISERINAMIGIAHPAFRESLAHDANARWGFRIAYV